MSPFFTPNATDSAYATRYHFSWYTHGRQPRIASPATPAALVSAFDEVVQARDYHVLEREIEPHAFRTLLSLKPYDSPAEVTRVVKGNLASAARNRVGVSQLWSRGWFVRSVGDVTNEIVREYVANQYDHHQAAPICDPGAAIVASYHHPGDAKALRRSAHAVFEYNVHVVFVTHYRRELLDLQVAQSLVDYLRRVCQAKQWIPWELNVVTNHAHAFIGLTPSDAPGDVALSLMNNSEFYLQRRHGRAWRDEVAVTLWRPGYYVGTVGSATTAQVKAYLRSQTCGEVEGEAPPR